MPHLEEPTNGNAINGSKPTRRGVYLLTHPRSASNLFQTMMAKQKSRGADVQCSSYHFFNAAFAMFMQMDRGSLQSSEWTEADRAALYEPYKAAFEGLNRELANAEQQVSLTLFSCNRNEFWSVSRSEVAFRHVWRMINYSRLWRAHASSGPTR